MDSSWQEMLDNPAHAMCTVCVMADLLGFDVQIVGNYDNEGLIISHRSAGHQRLYSRDDVARLARAVPLAEEGIPMVGIHRLVELEDQVDVKR